MLTLAVAADLDAHHLRPLDDLCCVVRVRKRTRAFTQYATSHAPMRCAALRRTADDRFPLQHSSIDRKFLRGESDELQWNLDVERKERLRKLSYLPCVARAVPHARTGGSLRAVPLQRFGVP